MIAPIVFHEDVFDEYFKPVLHPEARREIWGGYGLETFGHDFEIVRRHYWAYVWTVVDSCINSDQWIVPGVHIVNRVCYLTTEIPHKWVDVEFRVPYRGYSLTEHGLKRQISKLSRIMKPPHTYPRRLFA
jgi:hypothetical protein